MGKLTSTSATSSYDVAARRAWRMLRLALLWASKGNILKARLITELKHKAQQIKNLNHHHHHDHHQYHSSMSMVRYGERELSFDETPVISLRQSSRHCSLRFIMPCIKPEIVNFEYDFRDEYDDEMKNEQWDERTTNSIIEDEEEEGIDAKAEDFINKFYKEMKLQREISFQQRRLNTTNEVV